MVSLAKSTPILRSLEKKNAWNTTNLIPIFPLKHTYRYFELFINRDVILMFFIKER